MASNPRSLADFVRFWRNGYNYTNVTMTGISRTGRVMPVRDVDDASSGNTARVLRGEDVAWLLENCHRLHGIWDYSGTDTSISLPTSVSNTILKSNLEAADDALTAFASGASGKSQFLTNDAMVFSSADLANVIMGAYKDNYSGLLQRVSSYPVAYSAQSFSNGLVGNEIRNLFLAINNFSDSTFVIFPETFSTTSPVERYNWPSGTRTTWSKDSGSWTSSTSTEASYTPGYGYTQYSATDYKYNDGVADGDLKVKLPDCFLGNTKGLYLCENNYYDWWTSSDPTALDARLPTIVTLTKDTSETSHEVYSFPSWYGDSSQYRAYIANIFTSGEIQGSAWPVARRFYLVALDLDSDLSALGWSYTPN